MEFLRQNNSHYAEASTSSKIGVGDVLYLIIAATGLLGNLLVTIILIKEKRFHETSYYMILNLAVVDLISYTVYICNNFVVDNLVENPRGATRGLAYCRMIAPPFNLYTMFTQISIYSLLGIAIERVVDMYGGMAKKCGGFIIALAWILGAAMIADLTQSITIKDGKCVWERYSMRKGFMVFLTGYVIPAITMGVLYCFITYSLGKQNEDLDESEQALHDTVASRRINHILGLVTTAFIILWFPKSLLDLLNLSVVFNILKRFSILGYFGILDSIFNLLASLSTMIRPIIYFIWFADFRRAVGQIYRCPVSRAKDQDTTTTSSSTQETSKSNSSTI